LDFFAMPVTQLLTFKKRETHPSWLDIVWKALYQLTMLYPERQHFHYYQDLCIYIENNWQRLAQGKDRTATWTNTVSSTITTHKLIFKPGPEHGYWGLRKKPCDPTPLSTLKACPEHKLSPPPRGSPVKPARRINVAESSPKRQRSDKWSSYDSEDSSTDAQHDTPISIEAPAPLPVEMLPVLPPIHVFQNEEEYVDIEGCSEEESFPEEDAFALPSRRQTHLLSHEAPCMPSWCERPLVDADNELMTVFANPANEDWFQSLFAV